MFTVTESVDPGCNPGIPPAIRPVLPMSSGISFSPTRDDSRIAAPMCDQQGLRRGRSRSRKHCSSRQSGRRESRVDRAALIRDAQPVDCAAGEMAWRCSGRYSSSGRRRSLGIRAPGVLRRATRSPHLESGRELDELTTFAASMPPRNRYLPIDLRRPPARIAGPSVAGTAVLKRQPPPVEHRVTEGACSDRRPRPM